MKNTDAKMIFTLTLGSVFEIFDFLSFVFLSSIIAKLFFPKDIQTLAILFTYLTITISYLLRPIGGLVLAHFGDKYGRKSVFTASLLLMSLPSLAIGLLPTFQQVGYIATICMVFARLLQGFSLGGEVPGAITYIAEKFKTRNYFFYCTWLSFGANVGVALAAYLIHLLIQHSSPEFMESIGWRIPFLVGSLLALVGFYVRYSLKESESFQALQQQKSISRAPILTLFQDFKPALVSGVLLAIIVSLTTSLFLVFLPSLFTTYLHFNLNITSNVSALGSLTLAVFSVLIAYFASLRNAISIVRTGLIVLIVLFALLFTPLIDLKQLLSDGHVTLFYSAIVLIAIALAGINGLFSGILASLFPTQVRFSGISFCFNVAYILGAGLTPLWASSLIVMTGSYRGLMGVCCVVAAIAFINTYFLKRLLKRDHIQE